MLGSSQLDDQGAGTALDTASRSVYARTAGSVQGGIELETRVESTDDQVAHVVLDGELDLASVPAFERAITEGAARATEKVILDMRGLEFIDSSGLYAVIKADERTRAGGRRLVIVRGQRAVRYVFELAMLEDHFEFVDTPEYV